MIKRRILALVLSASALAVSTLAVSPALAFRGGGFGGFHGGGDFGGYHAESFHGPDGGGATVVHGPDGGVAAVGHGPNGAYGGAWHGGSWGGYHGPAVVNSYYGGGCYACGGVAVGAAVGAYAIGSSLATLPPNCGYRIVNGGAYYVCGSTWLNPRYGANGVVYEVVPPL